MYLGVVAAVAQYFQTKVMMPALPPTPKKNDFSNMFQKQMLYLFPFLILIWSRTFPSALILYWTVSNIFGIMQALLVKKRTSQEAGGTGGSL